MRFFVGALALSVICVLVGGPAALLVGWRPSPVGDRQMIGKSVKDRGPSVSTQAANQTTEISKRPPG
jgi:hypothetical protein